jgi:hypothetical protein
MAKSFAEQTVETSNTTGTGTYTLEGAKGDYLPFSASFSNGDKPVYVVRNRDNTKWEMNRGGALSIGSPPDTLARGVWKSTNGNAAVSWTTDDLPLTVYIPASSELDEGVVTGWLASARHALLRAGASFWTYADIAVRWRRQIATGDAAQVDDGIYDVAKTVWVGYQNAPIRDTGTSGSTIATSAAASDRGYIVSHNTAAAARVAALPAAATAGEGFYVGIYADGIFPTFIDTNGSEAVDNAVVPPGHVVWFRSTGSKWLSQGRPTPMGRRQTVARGPLSSGAPNLLATVSGLALSTSNVAAAAPLVVRASNGDAERWGWSTGNVSFGNLTDSTTSYLYVTVGTDGLLTGGKTTLAPIYQESGTPSTTSGQFTFNYGEMKGYLGNGSTADEVFMVFVGEAVTSGGNVTAVTAYAYNGRYDSGWTSTLPSSGTIVSKNHNIGCHPERAVFVIECTSADGGFAVGDRVVGPHGGANSVPQEFTNSIWCNRIAGGINTIGSATSAWAVTRKDTGAAFGLTLANWKYKLMFERRWG